MEVDVNLFPLRFTHEDCAGNLLPDCLYITEEGKLLIVGHCALCGTHIQATVTVEYLITHTPVSEPKPVRPTLIDPVIIAQDDSFLRELGIDPDPPKRLGEPDEQT